MLNNKLDVTYEELAKEHKSLSSMVNNLIKHTQINHEWIGLARASAKDRAKDVYNTRHNNRKTAIEKKNYLQSKVDDCYYGDKSDPVVKDEYKLVARPVRNLIYSAMIRQERILIIQAEFLDLDDIQAEADRGGLSASGYWRHIKTDNGWRNSIEIEGLKDSDPSTFSYTEKEKVNSLGYGNGSSEGSQIVYHVDQNWMSEVQKKGIAESDIGGKRVLVTSAKEVVEHELKDQGVQLYKCTVIYTRVPIGTNTYNMPMGKAKEFFFVEDRHIAVQTLPSGGKQQASGKDASWAIRTMKMRLKSTMMKQMGLK